VLLGHSRTISGNKWIRFTNLRFLGDKNGIWKEKRQRT
jgi:hypothetical protein